MDFRGLIYLAMFDAQAAAFVEQRELDQDEVTHEHLAVSRKCDC